MDILCNNELLAMKFYTDVKNILMEGTVSQIVICGLVLIKKNRVTTLVVLKPFF